jgi:hypothetical protein
MKKKEPFIKAAIYVLCIFATLLFSMQILLPAVILKKINETLRKSKKYQGYVSNVDVNILKGEYIIESLVLKEKLQNQAHLECIVESLQIYIHPGFFGQKTKSSVIIENLEMNNKNSKLHWNEMFSDTTLKNSIDRLVPGDISSVKVERGLIAW